MLVSLVYVVPVAGVVGAEEHVGVLMVPSAPYLYGNMHRKFKKYNKNKDKNDLNKGC